MSVSTKHLQERNDSKQNNKTVKIVKPNDYLKNKR